MTYNVFGGTLNLVQSINNLSDVGSMTLICCLLPLLKVYTHCCVSLMLEWYSETVVNVFEWQSVGHDFKSCLCFIWFWQRSCYRRIKLLVGRICSLLR